MSSASSSSSKPTEKKQATTASIEKNRATAAASASASGVKKATVDSSHENGHSHNQASSGAVLEEGFVSGGVQASSSSSPVDRYALHRAIESSDNHQLKEILDNLATDEEFGDEDYQARDTKSSDDGGDSDSFAGTLHVDIRDRFGHTPLHYALLFCNFEAVKLLLDHGASTDIACDGATTAHIAIKAAGVSGNDDFGVQVVERLIYSDVPINVVDDQDRTPFMFACYYGLGNTMSGLLAVREARQDEPLWAFNMNDKDKRGWTALHWAASGGHSEALTAIIKEGIDMGILDTDGNSAAHIAAQSNHQAALEVLRQYGLDVNQKNRFNMTPLDYSNEYSGQRANSLLVYDDKSMDHLTCSEPPCYATHTSPPPENKERLNTLLSGKGVLRSPEFNSLNWMKNSSEAAISDILRVHEYSYIRKLTRVCEQCDTDPNCVVSLDDDTAVSKDSWDAAKSSAGAVCKAVDLCMKGEASNVFCAIRPPGHHAGPYGKVENARDPHGSHGFCLLNNVAIAAAYARSKYGNQSLSENADRTFKVAIVDFDVHHGNGTEACIKNLVPHARFSTTELPVGEIRTKVWSYKPWLDENDGDNVFFLSSHGFGPKFPSMESHPHMPYFYSGSGQNRGHPGLGFTNAWGQTGDDPEFAEEEQGSGDEDHYGSFESSVKDPHIVNVAVPYGCPSVYWKRLMVNSIFPKLVEFNPDLIFISAGFDAHEKDDMSFGYMSLIETDYTWITEQLVKIANTCCNGRIISMLEGGYRIKGLQTSAFAMSVAAHVKALNKGITAKWDGPKESKIVETMFESERGDKTTVTAAASGGPEMQTAEGLSSRRSTRKRAAVDYQKLKEEMEAEERKRSRTESSAASASASLPASASAASSLQEVLGDPRAGDHAASEITDEQRRRMLEEDDFSGLPDEEEAVDEAFEDDDEDEDEYDGADSGE